MPSSTPPQERFDAYVDGELMPDEAAGLEQLVAQDLALETQFNNYLSLVNTVRSLPVEAAPVDFYAHVRRRIRRRTRRRHNGPTVSHSVVFEAAVCAVLIGVLCALYVYAAGDRLESPGADAVQNQVARVYLNPEDRRELSQLGLITAIGTGVTGTDLEVEIDAPLSRESQIRAAVRGNPRFHFIETSVHRRGSRLRLRIRAPAGPTGP
jgi:hypothetical protein